MFYTNDILKLSSFNTFYPQTQVQKDFASKTGQRTFERKKKKNLEIIVASTPHPAI